MNEQSGKNVLILCMSTLNDKTMNYYRFKNWYYSCVSQLEAGTKTVIDMLAKPVQTNAMQKNVAETTDKQTLKVVVLNTPQTLASVSRNGLEEKSAFDFYKDRIESFVGGVDKQKAEFYVAQNRIEGTHRDIIDEKIEGYKQAHSLDDSAGTCDLQLSDTEIADLQKLSNQICSELDSMIRKEYELEKEEQQVVSDISARGIKIPAELKKIQESVLAQPQPEDASYKTDTQPQTEGIRQEIDSLPEDFDMRAWIRVAQEEVKKEHADCVRLSVLEKQLDKIIESQGELTFQMIVDYQQKIRDMKVLQQLQFVKLIDLWEENKERLQKVYEDKNIWEQLASDTEEALSEKEQECLQAMQKLDNSLRENDILSNIIFKLNKNLSTMESHYFDLVHRYVRQCLWERFVNEKENSFCRNINLEIHSIEIKNGIEEKLQDIEELVLGQENAEDPENIHVYVDTQGGMRDNIVMLTAVMQMLRIQNVQIEETFAIRYGRNNFINEVYTNKDRYQIYDLVTAMTDVISYMRGDKLYSYFKARFDKVKKLSGIVNDASAKKDEEFNQLKEQILDFLSSQEKKDKNRNLLCQLNWLTSDLVICRMDEFTEHVEAVRKRIGELSQAILDFLEESGDVLHEKKIELLRTTLFCLGKIDSSLAKDNEQFSEKINWCLNHGYIQQALTLGAESSAREFFYPMKIIAYPEGILFERYEDNANAPIAGAVTPLSFAERRKLEAQLANDILKEHKVGKRRKILPKFMCDNLGKSFENKDFKSCYMVKPLRKDEAFDIAINYLVQDADGEVGKIMLCRGGANEDFKTIKKRSEKKLEKIFSNNHRKLLHQLYFISLEEMQGIWEESNKELCETAYQLLVAYDNLKDLRNKINHANAGDITPSNVRGELCRYIKLLEEYERQYKEKYE